MKKFYEAPVAEELLAEAAALLNSDVLLSGGSDNSGDDLEWDQDLL